MPDPGDIEKVLVATESLQQEMTAAANALSAARTEPGPPKPTR